MTDINWNTSCPDWGEKIVKGESLMPCKALFPDEAEMALEVFKSLIVTDVIGQPTMGEITRPWVFEFVASIFGAYSEDESRRLIREFFLLIRRLNAAAQYHRDSALESASWGIGQVMGYHWEALGYPSLQAFINAMYKDEAEQLDAMCRYIKVNNLINALKNKDWKAFAKDYNGQSYSKNSYDIKLASAYKKWSQ